MLKNVKTAAVAAVLLLMLCLAACQKEARQADGGQKEARQAVKETQITGHVLSGSDDSPIRIEVFSDLQCPGCRELFLRVLKPVMEEYQDKVSVVYYEFPLNAHKYARPAARYVSAASKLERQKLLSVYTAIFNDQAIWETDGRVEESVFKALSNEDFLKVRQILMDADSLAKINETIEKDLQLGMSKGVNSTPTMFISYGGKEEKVEGAPTYKVMKQFLNSIVK